MICSSLSPSSSVYPSDFSFKMAEAASWAMAWFDSIGVAFMSQYYPATTGHTSDYPFGVEIHNKAIPDGSVYKIDRATELTAAAQLGLHDIHLQQPSVALQLKAIVKMGAIALWCVVTLPQTIVAAVVLFGVRIIEQYTLPPLTILQPTGKATCSKSGFKALSLNVALSETDIMNAYNGVGRSQTRAPGLLTFLQTQDCDVYLLQEAFDTELCWTEIIAEMRKLGYYAALTPRRRGVIGFNSGLITLSRFPITAGNFRAYDNAVGTDRYANKGVLTTNLDLGTKKLTVANTHMQAGVDGDTTKKIDVRLAQYNQALPFIAEAAGTNQILFGGDNNTGCFRTGKGSNRWSARLVPDYQAMVEGPFANGYRGLTAGQPPPPNGRTKYQNSETGTPTGSVYETFAYTYKYAARLQQPPFRKPATPDHFFLKGAGSLSPDLFSYAVCDPLSHDGLPLSDHAALVITWDNLV